MGQLHQHLLDMLGAKDHVEAGRIIGELQATALNEHSGNSGQLHQPGAAAGLNERFGDSEQLAPPDVGSGGDALDVPFAWTWISQAGERHVTTSERHARDVANADGCVVHAITPQMLTARQPVGVEPVAWQWRSRVKGGAWDAWENGRYGSEPAPFMEVQHRALYTAPPALAAVPVDGRRDSQRLDFLDRMNATLNARHGTDYGWQLILSPQIVRLMAGTHAGGYVGDIDLNDSQGGNAKLSSCRAAIDSAMLAIHPQPAAAGGDA
ncbi:hypothetical protein [Xanthomonas arboricola]|uniref:hypothetical protein n=1 Tax=Xanthomonas arboricola TaxID=56448 RepID=UPI000C81C3A1|nr:hypothetical protein [Xanthomonas arboricola]PPT23065.1 hypothetical protein XarCFBP6771_01235 [Xanthomonas arboricola]